MNLFEEIKRLRERRDKTRGELDSLCDRLYSELEHKDMELSTAKRMIDSYKKKNAEQRILLDNALSDYEQLKNAVAFLNSYKKSLVSTKKWTS